jgi:tetratricopeptide (TPR) repeat protein
MKNQLNRGFSLLMEHSSKKLYSLSIYLALVLFTFVAFEQIRHNNFVNYDDNLYVTENPHVKAGITHESVVWAFTTSHASNWHPLTWLSHMLDCELFGLNPHWHHLTNLFFHIANTLLLFWVLKKMTGRIWPSVFVAAAFALHPLHVESVAWVAERKDVLSTLFGLLTIAAYIRYAQTPNIGRYLLILLLFALGLMAKPMLVTLPFVLLLLDYWPLNRLQLRNQAQGSTMPQPPNNPAIQKMAPLRLFAEKIPLLALAAASSTITYSMQQRTGTTEMLGSLSLNTRLSNALVSYISYIAKLIYPNRLAVLYPHPGSSLPLWQPILAAAVLVAITVGVIYLARRGQRYLITGWLWYLGTLVPVIGLVQVGNQAMADRYTYLPSIGFFIMVAWGAAALVDKTYLRNIAAAISAGLVLAAMMICTRMQVTYWQNSCTLFKHTLSVTEKNFVIHNSYGNALVNNGRLNEAIGHYRLALKGKCEYAEAYNNLGAALSKQGKLDEGIECFYQALNLKPDYAEPHYNLAVTFKSQGNLDEAINHYRQAIHIKPDHIEAYTDLSIALVKQGKFEEALTNFYQALRLAPDRAVTHYNLGLALLMIGRFDMALQHLQEAASLKPDYAAPLNGMARILATCPDPNLRNVSRAIELANRAAKLTGYRDASVLETLAEAYAADSQFDQAVTTAQAALDLATAAQNNELADHIRKNLVLYRAKKTTVSNCDQPQDN